MRKLTIILIALTLIVGGLFAQANIKDRKVPAGRTPGEDPNPKLKDRLTPIEEDKSLEEMLVLSPKQTAKIDEIKTNLQKQMNVWIAQHQNLRLDKQKAMQSRDFDGAKKVTGEMFDLKKIMANARIDAIQAIFNELTDGQKAIVKDSCEKDGNGIGALLGGRMCDDSFRQKRGFRRAQLDNPEDRPIRRTVAPKPAEPTTIK